MSPISYCAWSTNPQASFNCFRDYAFIPGLARNSVGKPWIPAFAGMTWLSLCFGVTGY